MFALVVLVGVSGVCAVAVVGGVGTRVGVGVARVCFSNGSDTSASILVGTDTSAVSPLAGLKQLMLNSWKKNKIKIIYIYQYINIQIQNSLLFS